MLQSAAREAPDVRRPRETLRAESVAEPAQPVDDDRVATPVGDIGEFFFGIQIARNSRSAPLRPVRVVRAGAVSQGVPKPGQEAEWGLDISDATKRVFKT
jgi:hypothetical protein